MSKLFTFAGTCTERGATVYKFANNANRAKELERFGCTDVVLFELPKPMCKEEAVCFLEMTKGITANKAPRVAKEAAVKVKVTKEVEVVATKAKRVASEIRAGMNPVEFARAWFARQEAAVLEMRAAGKL
jgi:hypothetical protein